MRKGPFSKRAHLGGLPVLLYHGLTTVDPPPTWKYLVSDRELGLQLAAIRDRGLEICLLEDCWSGGPPPNGRPPVVLTFDDGLASAYEIALPRLLEAGARANFFINVSSVGLKGFLDWKQICEMQDQGMSIQSHGYDHVDLASLPVGELRKQLRESKHKLEDRLGRPVDFLAVPSGRMNRRVVELAVEEGYRAVCNSRSWPARPGSPVITRVPIYGRTSREDFERFLERSPVPYLMRVARSAAVYLPKRMLVPSRNGHGSATVSDTGRFVALRARSARPTPHVPLHVVVLIDALGWRTLEGKRFLEDVLPYRKPVRTVLGYSSGAIPTILTGKLPSEHGHWNLLYYDPEGSPFRWLRHFHFLPERSLDNRVTRRLLKEMGRRVLGLGPLFECCVRPRLLHQFDWTEKRNIYLPGGLSGARSLFDDLESAGVSYRSYSYHRFRDTQIFEEAIRDIRSHRAGFFFLYLSEIDHFLHHHCLDDAGVREKLEEYDRALRKVFEAARNVDPDARFMLFSDHGMTPVRHHYNLVEDVESLGLSTPEDYLAVYDSTMARFWFFNEKARASITSRLGGLSCGRLLSEKELRDLGVHFDDGRHGEAVFLLNPGWLLAGGDFSGPKWLPEGMHGYHPDDPYSDATFLADRKPARPVETLADLYPVMRDGWQGLSHE